MKEDRVHRLLRLLTLMQSDEPCDVENLRERLAVSRRTLFRDLRMLNGAGIRYAYDAKAKTYTLTATSHLRPLELTVAEALAVLRLARTYVPREMAPDFGTLQRAVAKIESILPPAIQAECQSLIREVDVRGQAMADGQRLGSTFGDLAQAAAEQRKVQMQYDSYFDRNVLNNLVLHPYRVTFLARAWYVIGYSEFHHQVRTFKLDRIEQLATLKDTFTLKKSFDIESYFGKAWVMIPEGKVRRVRIRFSPMVGGNVEEVLWHPTQHIEHNPDGSIVFEAEVDGVREISWWVLGYVDQAEVLAPPELRDLVAERLQSAATMYGGREGQEPSKSVRTKRVKKRAAKARKS